MKRIFNRATGLFSLLILTMLLTGCKTPAYTSFAPFDARLESVPNSVAKYLVFVNISEQELHNFSFSAYLWDDHSEDRFRSGRPIQRYMGSGARLMPGQMIRFHPQGLGIEAPLQQNVSRLEIIGHSREGDFRELWRSTPSGNLQLVPVSPQN
jgi:hypothetical protein